MGKEGSVVPLDLILRQLGAFGRYNIQNYALLLFPIYLAGMYTAVYVFEAPDIHYRCKIPECEGTNESLWLAKAIPMSNGEYSKCRLYPYKARSSITGQCLVDSFDNNSEMPCSSFVYGEQDSAIKDFDLGCQNWKRTLIGSVHNFGLFFSLPLTGIVSDKYGRKRALSIASLMNGIFGIMRSFSPNYVTMLVFEFLETATGAGAYSTSFVFAMELVGPKGRVFGNTLVNIAYVIGLITLSVLAWILNDWRTLLRIIYFPALLVVSYYWILDESVRWLLAKGRNSEAVAILQKAAKTNKVELSEELLSPLLKKKSKSTLNGHVVSIDISDKSLEMDTKESRENDKETKDVNKGNDKDLKRNEKDVKEINDIVKDVEEDEQYIINDKENVEQSSKDINGDIKDFKEMKEKQDESISKKIDLEAGSGVKPVSQFKQAIRSRIIRYRLMVCSFLWISCTFVYYGLSINSVALAGNMYANFILVSFVEIPANIVCLLVLDKFGRKRTLITMYVLSACLCISLSFVPKDVKWCSLIVYLSGKFSITVAYSGVYVYVSEVFPTSVRQSMLAICSAIGRVGSTLAPLTPLLALYYKNLPAMIFGGIALVASLLVFTLPETLNVALPDTIEEAEGLSNKPSSAGVAIAD